jgi:heptaprenyl diphosphate synthase
LSIAYSLAGGVLSFAIMCALKRSNKVDVVVVSMAAAIAHNVAQVLVAARLLETPAILLNLPLLAVVACITGAATGTVAKGVLAAIRVGVAQRLDADPDIADSK